MKFSDLVVTPETTLDNVMQIMTKNKKGIIFVAENHKLVGVASDGDIRRSITKNILLNSPVCKIMNINPIFANNEKEALKKLKTHFSLIAIPIIENDGEIKKIVLTEDGKIEMLDSSSVHDTKSKKLPNEKENIIAIIPARGNSKRLPRKNLLKVAGRPLIYWTIKAAKESKYLDSQNILVTTDDEEIAEFVKKTGVLVPWLRPKELAEDNTPTIDVIIHALDWATKSLESPPKYAVLLEPTAPLRTSEHIDKSIEILINSDADSVVSVSEMPHVFNPEELLVIKNNDLKPYIESRTMDDRKLRGCQIPAYTPNGLVYAFRVDCLLQKRSIFGDKTLPFVNSWNDFLDIDEDEDLKMADLKMRQRHFDRM